MKRDISFRLLIRSIRFVNIFFHKKRVSSYRLQAYIRFGGPGGHSRVFPGVVGGHEGELIENATFEFSF